MGHEVTLFSSSRGYQTLDLQSNTTSRITTSVSGKTQRIKTGAQSWTFKLKSPALTRDEMMRDYATLVSKDGQVDAFTIVPPIVSSTRSTNASGTPTVLSTYGAGTSVVRANGGSGTLKQGDMIKFSNHSKVYMLTHDVNQDESSEDSFQIYPPLVTAVTNSATIIYNNVEFTVYLDTDQIKTLTQADGTFKYEIVCIEEI